MAPLRYLTPFPFLALLFLGGWLGGSWTFATALAIPLCLTVVDCLLGKEDREENGAASSTMRWLPAIYIVLHLAVTSWIAFRIGGGGTGLLEDFGLALSSGMTTGVFGMVAAHELIHSRDRSQRALGLGFLASVFYMHFRISHLYGHHRRAATFEDPASARLGESLYAFLYRSIAGQFREAWVYEKQRRRRSTRSPIAGGNRMAAYLGIELLILTGVGMTSLRALLFVLANAAIAIVLLETFNYVAHYGLSRGTGRLGPEHSWNSRNWMNNSALFNMGRHSDHHRHNAHAYERLASIHAEPELPAGYAAAMITALVPPLWRTLMDRRVESRRLPVSSG